MRTSSTLLITAILLTAPAVARAQVHVSPFAGVTFGGDTTTRGGTAGLSATYWVFNWLAVEAEAATTPEFFAQDGFLIERSMTTFTGQVVVTLPRFGTRRIQPFVVAGLGALRPKLAEAGALTEVSGQTLGLTVGAGARAWLNDRVGVRADLRYLRGLRESDLDTNAFGVDFSSITFWRSTVGVVVRF